MIGPLKMRSVGIVCDEQETPAPSPVPTSLQKSRSPRWEPFDGPLSRIPCSGSTKNAIGNGMHSIDRQPCPIQNT
jgi:hypothetical protein